MTLIYIILILIVFAIIIVWSALSLQYIIWPEEMKWVVNPDEFTTFGYLCLTILFLPSIIIRVVARRTWKILRRLFIK